MDTVHWKERINMCRDKLVMCVESKALIYVTRVCRVCICEVYELKKYVEEVANGCREEVTFSYRDCIFEMCFYAGYTT